MVVIVFVFLLFVIGILLLFFVFWLDLFGIEFGCRGFFLFILGDIVIVKGSIRLIFV